MCRPVVERRKLFHLHLPGKSGRQKPSLVTILKAIGKAVLTER